MASHLAFLTLAVLTVFLFLATFPKGGDAIKCYVCNSMNASESGCRDEFRKTTTHDRIFLRECAPDEKFCRKQHQNIRGEIRVSRSCGHEWDDKKGDGECLQVNNEDIRQLSCQCKGDMCNGAGWPVVSVVTFLLPSMLLFFRNL